MMPRMISDPHFWKTNGAEFWEMNDADFWGIINVGF